MQPNVHTVLTDMTAQLKAAGITTARLDVLVLMEDVVGMDRAHLLAHLEKVLTPEHMDILRAYIARRAEHTPLAYIRGKTSFYGREFAVNEYTLVPRPETEVLIDMFKALPLPPDARIADIGTGSGCIGITAALEIPSCHVCLYDIDTHALAEAQVNIRALGAKNVTTQQSDLLYDVQSPLDVILANLPYVPDDFPINQAATHEPRLALFAGKDGMNAYRVLWSQLQTFTGKPACVLTESLPMQHANMAIYAKPAGYIQRAVQGFIQVFERED